MKKFYVLAAAAAVALSAAAQDKIYVVGAWGGADHWNMKDMKEITKTGDNFVFSIDALSAFKMSTNPIVLEGEGEEAKESWTSFDEGNYGCMYGFKVGEVKELFKGGGNIAAPYVANYTVTIAGDFSTVLLQTSDPNPDGGFNVFFRGGMNDWGAPAEWQFTCVDKENLIYEFNCGDALAIQADVEFKVADANWGSINFGMPQKMNPETEQVENLAFFPLEDTQKLVYNNNANLLVKEEFYGKAFFNLSTYELYMTNDTEAENPFLGQGAVNDITVEGNGAAAYYNLQGVRVSEPANGLYIVVKDGKATKVIR